MEIFPGSLKYDAKLCVFILKYIVWIKNKHCKDMQVLDKWNSESLLYILYKDFPVSVVSISTFFSLVQCTRSIELTEVSPKMMFKTKQCRNWKGREKEKHFKFYSERKSGVDMLVWQKPRL